MVVRQTILWPAVREYGSGDTVTVLLLLSVGVWRCGRARPATGQQASSRGPVSGPGKNNKMPDPLRSSGSGPTHPVGGPTETLPGDSRGSTSSPVVPALSSSTEPANGRRIRLEAGLADPQGVPRWHKLGCSRPGPGRWVEPCKDCAGQPGHAQPSGAAYATSSGERWHQEGCGHIRGRRQVRYEQCLCHHTMRSRSFSKDIYSNFLKLFIKKSLGVDQVAVCSILQVLPSLPQIGTCGGTIYHAMPHSQQVTLSMTLQCLKIWHRSNIDTPTAC